MSARMPGSCTPRGAAARLLTVLAFVAVVASTRTGDWTRLAALALGLASAWAIARASLRAVLVRLAIAQPFVVGLELLALFQPDGLRVAATLAGKSTLCILALAVLADRTRFTDLLAGLRALRVPALLVTALGLTERYLALLVGEARRASRAVTSRTFSRRRAGVRAASAAGAAAVFLRATARAERVALAMRARGLR